MTGPRFEVGDDEPAVRSPALRALVEQARVRPLPSLRVDLDAVRMAAADHRSRRWRTVAIAAAAVAIAAVALSVLPRPEAPTEGGGEPTVARTSADPSAAVEQPTASPSVAEPEPPTPRPEAEAPPPVVPHLASGVRFEPRDATRARFTIVSTWSVDVASGVYRIEVPQDAVESLRVSVRPGRVLEVHPGAEVELDAAGNGRVTLLQGRATWIDADGRRRAVTFERAPTDGAAALARTAEQKMAAGDWTGAIEALESLVRKHPRSAAAKAGLLDLARLYRADGRSDRARCAYGTYLERWPGSRVQGEVEQALADLGGGDCHSI